MARGGAGNLSLGRLLEYDEDGLGKNKRDDDLRQHLPPSRNRGDQNWQPRGPAATWTANAFRLRQKRRWIVLAGVVLLLWLFHRGLPEDFWEPNATGRERLAKYHSSAASGSYAGQRGGRDVKVVHEAGGGPPPRPPGKRREYMHYYDGEIVFEKLLASLQAARREVGFVMGKANVIFAASNPRSLSTLTPLACEMANRQKGFVHVLLMGRNELALEELLRMNGVDAEECKARWHDARPNWAQYSSEFRAEASVASALEHMQEFLRPHVMLTDDSVLEDGFFTRQIRMKSVALDWPVIELPGDASERLQWITRLDAQSLRAWHSSSLDIIVQAPKGQSGNLIRLLKSLAEAEYHGLTVPKLTIELPAEVDMFTSWYLAQYKWPPGGSPLQPALSNRLTLRHRIPGQTLSAEEASVRFMETFYPKDPLNSHVLVLNPNVELSPLWLHWLKYHLLRYKHSRDNAPFADRLMGLSMQVPTLHLNGTAKFEPPAAFAPSADSSKSSSPQDDVPAFLWEAPDADAAVYFGDKWAEAQDFLRHRIRKFRDGQLDTESIIGNHMPVWTRYFLEIMRARGWSMLHPPSSAMRSGVVTVHKELQKPPEELEAAFIKARAKIKKTSDADESENEPSETLSGQKAEPLRGHPSHWENQIERPISHSTQLALHATLPLHGEEPSLAFLPHFLYDGSPVSQPEFPAEAAKYAQWFKENVGGCESRKGMIRVMEMGRAGDLFCWPEEEGKGWVKDGRVEE